jgi:hypothetical protein
MAGSTLQCSPARREVASSASHYRSDVVAILRFALRAALARGRASRREDHAAHALEQQERCERCDDGHDNVLEKWIHVN